MGRRMRRRTAAAAISLAAIGALPLGACTFALPFEDECQVDLDCESVGLGLRCVDSLCVGVSADDVGAAPCDVVYGVPEAQASDPKTILIGALLPKTGDSGTSGPGMERALFLAIDEINSAGGIDGRKFAVVSCDSGSTAEKAALAAEFLVEKLRVPAVVGPTTSGETIEAFTAVAKDAGVLLVSPSATSAVITDLDDDGLLWRTAPSDALQGEALGRYLASEGFGKVAIVYRDDAYGSALAATIRETWCKPGGPTACIEDDTDPGWNLLVRLYEAEEAVKQSSDQADAVIALDAFAPDVTVVIGFAVDGISFMNLAAQRDPPHTRFILPDGVKEAKLFEGLDADDLGAGVEPIDLAPDVLCPILGTNPADPSSDVFQAFATRFSSKWNTPPEVFGAHTYDATWLIAYAWAAASRTTSVPSGKDLALAMKRMSEGTEIKAGLGDFTKGAGILSGSAAGTIDFRGASGELQFDPETGEAKSSIEAWRVNLSKPKLVSMGVLLTEEGVYTPPVFDAETLNDDICEPILEEAGFFRDGGGDR